MINVDLHIITWWQFLVILLIVGICYFIGKRIIGSETIKESVWYQRRTSRSILQKTDLFLLPLSTLILIIVFVMVNPFINGLLTLMALVVFYIPTSHWIHGLAIRNEHLLEIDQEIETETYKGRIEKIGNLGLQLRSPNGVKFVNYSNLLEAGLVSSTSLESKALVDLRLQVEEGEENKFHLLNEKLAFVPYIDWTRNFKTTNVSPTEIQLSMYLKSDEFQDSIVRLLKEWGFKAIIGQSK